jgi:hypothetical protein
MHIMQRMQNIENIENIFNIFNIFTRVYFLKFQVVHTNTSWNIKSSVSGKNHKDRSLITENVNTVQ